ncbi:hypothetical protein WJX77_001317 [Trebouxia sp. C0004]
MRVKTAVAEWETRRFRKAVAPTGQVGRPPLLSKEGKSQVLQNTFFLVCDRQELGGGFFHAPGKAVTTYHDTEQHQRNVTILTNGTDQQRIDMRVAMCSKALDYAGM